MVILSDSPISVEINGNFPEIIQSNEPLLSDKPIYLIQQIINNTFTEGELNVTITNATETIIDNSIIIQTSAPIITISIENNSENIPRIGDEIIIHLNSNNDLYTFPKINHSNIHLYANNNFEEISKDLVIWTNTNAKTWFGTFIYDLGIALEDFIITCIDMVGNISTIQYITSQHQNLNQSDWNESDNNKLNFIKNKPDLSLKVDKVEGKQLSTNDFTNSDVSKLNDIENGAQVNKIEAIKLNGELQNIVNKEINLILPTQIQSDYNQTDNTQIDFIKNKPDLTNFGGVEQYPTYSEFPNEGNVKKIYIDLSKKNIYFWDNSNYIKAQYIFENNILVSLGNLNGIPKTIGRYINGDTILSAGKTFEEVMNDIATETQYPIINNPTLSLNYSFTNPSSSVTHGYQIIGNQTNIYIIFSFNPGSIMGNISDGIWNTGISQGNRAGDVQRYNYTSNNGSNNTNFSIFQLTLDIIQGYNTISGNVWYLQGMQPLDSNGENYLSPLPENESALNTSTSFEGVFPIFATTVNINTQTQQNLFSMINGNNIQINLIAESGGNKQTFWVPTTWINSRPLNQILYFNTISNQFDNTNKLSEFDQINDTIEIFSNNISYKKFIYNGADRGNTLIKLIF